MKRAVYLDIARVIACFMVVGVHVSAMCWEDISVNTLKWQTLNAYDCFCMLGVPVFFMLSGALFLHEDSNVSLKNLYIKKILHLVVVYHVWLFFYNTLPFFNKTLELNYYNVEERVKVLLMGQGIYHLWFLPQLIMLYCLSPILKVAFAKKEICEYFLILFLILGAIMPTVLKFQFPYKIFVESYYFRAEHNMTVGYIGYFVLGHYIHSFVSDKWEKKNGILLALIGFLSILLQIAICGYWSIKIDEPSTIVNSPLTIFPFVACFAGMTIMKKGIKKEKGWLVDGSRKIGGLTLGIYLLHPFILMILSKYGVSTLNPHPVFMIPFITTIVFAICAVIIFIIKKIPILRYCV